MWFRVRVCLYRKCVYVCEHVFMTDRQTDTRTDRQTGRQTKTQTERQTEIHRRTDRQTGRQTKTQTERQTDRQIVTETSRQKERRRGGGGGERPRECVCVCVWLAGKLSASNNRESQGTQQEKVRRPGDQCTSIYFTLDKTYSS